MFLPQAGGEKNIYKLTLWIPYIIRIITPLIIIVVWLNNWEPDPIDIPGREQVQRPDQRGERRGTDQEGQQPGLRRADFLAAEGECGKEECTCPDRSRNQP